jgi:hypothetical protein
MNIFVNFVKTLNKNYMFKVGLSRWNITMFFLKTELMGS